MRAAATVNKLAGFGRLSGLRDLAVGGPSLMMTTN